MSNGAENMQSIAHCNHFPSFSARVSNFNAIKLKNLTSSFFVFGEVLVENLCLDNQKVPKILILKNKL